MATGVLLADDQNSAGYRRILSSLVLERISQLAWTSDKLSKELSPGPFRRLKYPFKQDEETMQREYPAGNE
jgi:hypothetical protein